MNDTAINILGFITYAVMGLAYAFFLYLAAVRWLDHIVNRAAQEAVANLPERVRYAHCKFCEQRITEGATQLEAWQAYAAHVREWHQ